MKTAFYISLLAACTSALTLSDTFDSNFDETLLAEDVSQAENNSFEDMVLSQAYDDLSEEGGAAPYSLAQASRMGVAWTDRDAEVKSSWRIARPNCCLFYEKINFGGKPTEVCYNQRIGGRNKAVTHSINSLECGSRAYSLIGTSRG